MTTIFHIDTHDYEIPNRIADSGHYTKPRYLVRFLHNKTFADDVEKYKLVKCKPGDDPKDLYEIEEFVTLTGHKVCDLCRERGIKFTINDIYSHTSLKELRNPVKQCRKRLLNRVKIHKLDQLELLPSRYDIDNNLFETITSGSHHLCV
jgi:hypothetical protein